MSAPGYKLTESVFKEAERYHRDLMEPWSTLVAEIDDAGERQRLMRQGLAATFRERYPMPPALWPTPSTPAQIAAWDSHLASIAEARRKARELFAKWEAVFR